MRTELKKFRIGEHLTQEQFARKIGYNRSMYMEVENGKREPSMRFCVAISETFGIPMAEVLELVKRDEER